MPVFAFSAKTLFMKCLVRAQVTMRNAQVDVSRPGVSVQAGKKITFFAVLALEAYATSPYHLRGDLQVNQSAINIGADVQGQTDLWVDHGT